MWETNAWQGTVGFQECISSLLTAQSLLPNNPEILFLWGKILCHRSLEKGDASLILEAAFKFESVLRNLEVEGRKISDVLTPEMKMLIFLYVKHAKLQ